MHRYQKPWRGAWYYVRRVPTAFAHLDKRNPVRVSANIAVADDPEGWRAARVIDRLDKETEAYWRGLLEGQAVEAQRRYDAARTRARALGFDYMPAMELAAKPIGDLLDRAEVLRPRDAAGSGPEIAAVLGGEDRPDFRLSTLFGEYERLSRASLKEKSEDQLRKWRNPKKRAVANLMTVIGDKRLSEITRNDALDFQAWWQDRIVGEGREIETANKDIGHINRMLRTLERWHRLGLPPVFSELRIEGGRVAQRQAYDAGYVRDRLFAPGALDGLNEEARAVIWLVAETGLRLSEACNLTVDTIHLDEPVPYVAVRPDGRQMKTDQSAREIPLLGGALAAAKRFPEGFPRYRHRADALSALVNKYLDTAGLRPSKQHTLYSLRHTFEDRLTAVGAPEKVMAALMGHKYIRPKYGAGPSLALKAQWIGKIAFPT